MSQHNIVDELNRENERRLLKPLIIGLACMLFIAPIVIGVILRYKESIDAFSMKHPVILAFCFLIPGVVGAYKYGKTNNLW